MTTTELIHKLRSTQSVSKRKLLDEAADTIEALLADMKRFDIDCVRCKHQGRRTPCYGMTEWVECCDCTLDCPCKDCYDNSGYEWEVDHA